MNIQASQTNNHLLFWIAITLLLAGVGLGDTAIVAWYASAATVWQLAGFLFSFALIGAGVLFTVWQMRR